VLGRLFLVADPDAADPGLRRIRVIGREPSGAGTIVGDPTASGGQVFVAANDDVQPPEEGQTFPLPAPRWSARPTGFLYRDPTGLDGAVRLAAIRDDGRAFQVKVVIGPRAPFTIPVVPPPAGTDGGATLTLHGGDSYCVRFGGAGGGRVRNLTTPAGGRIFRVARATAEAGCVHCSDQGGGMCGGACGPSQFCADLGSCQCLFVFGTTTVPFASLAASTSTSSTLAPGASGPPAP
jgi:hypothetical protein